MSKKYKYGDSFHFADTSLVVIDSSGSILQINLKAQNTLYLDGINDQGKKIGSIIASASGAVKKFLQQKSHFLGHHLQHADISLILDLIPVVQSGEFMGGICSFRHCKNVDFSAKKTTSYKEINQQLEAIFAASSDGIWVCDGTGKVIRVNQASAQLNGIKAANVIGKNMRDLSADVSLDQSVALRVLKSGKRETVMQYIEKTKKYLLSTGTPTIDESGEVTLIVVNERDITELNLLKQKFEQTKRVSQKYREELSGRALLESERNNLVAESPGMRLVVQMALKLANIGASNILILGESGTGKSMLSKLIHKNSSRHKNPFVEINCAAMPESLLEAELFGYEKGAFTGANPKGKVGLFEMAHQGTLFLDEIGDMPLQLQTKLLKYLDNHEIRRVGGTEVHLVECSVIAATNQDLLDLVKQKKFREDLYYRLNSFTLKIPPLRGRFQDISKLVRLYLEQFNIKYLCSKKMGSATMQTLLQYNFPGNIRELKNIVENGVVMADSDRIDDFVQVSLGHNAPAAEAETMQHTTEDFDLRKNLKNIEKSLLTQAAQSFSTTREMARHLGISQPSVVRKLKEHSISK